MWHVYLLFVLPCWKSSCPRQLQMLFSLRVSGFPTLGVALTTQFDHYHF